MTIDASLCSVCMWNSHVFFIQNRSFFPPPNAAEHFDAVYQLLKGRVKVASSLQSTMSSYLVFTTASCIVRWNIRWGHNCFTRNLLFFFFIPLASLGMFLMRSRYETSTSVIQQAAKLLQSSHFCGGQSRFQKHTWCDLFFFVHVEQCVWNGCNVFLWRQFPHYI